MITNTSVEQPSDWVIQSFPFSYLYVDAMSVDGQSHSVQIYSDISAGNPLMIQLFVFIF